MRFALLKQDEEFAARLVELFGYVGMPTSAND